MHNQDTAKDDFMEAIMEIMNKLAEFYKINKEKEEKNKTKVAEKKEIDLESDSEKGEEITDERVLRFQKAMKEIINETDKEDIKSIAQSFHDNPVESMKMLSAVISEQAVGKAQHLADKALSTGKLLGEVKSAINMNDPRAMDLIATIDALKNDAENDYEVAQSLIKDVRPLYQEESLKQTQNGEIGDSVIAVGEKIERGEAEELLYAHFNNLSAAEKDEFEKPEIHFNEDKQSLILHFESKKGIEPKTKSLILNLEEGTGREVNVSSNSNGLEKSNQNTNDLTVSELRQLRDKNKVNEIEKEEKDEKQEAKKEKSKNREMDGPER